MKRILITDTHLGHKKASDLYLELTAQLFEDIGTYAQEHEIVELIHLGDFFDNRRVLNVKTLNYAHTIAGILDRDFETYIIFAP